MFHIIGTISGINCRKKIAKLKVGEKYKSRFGLYLSKDFIPVAKYNTLLPYESFHHFHMFLNSQNFDLTADRNNISNLDNEKIKWILTSAKRIIDLEIIPVAQASYFRMRRKEESNYIKKIKYHNLDLEYNKSKILKNLNINNICLKKEPHNSFTILLLLIVLLSNKSYKKYIKEIEKVIYYSNDLIYKVYCENNKGENIIIGIEYALLNIYNINILNTIDIIICWKSDIISNQGENGIEIIEREGEYYMKIEGRIIKVIELAKVIQKIKML